MKVLLVANQVIHCRDYDGICLSIQVSLPRIRSQIFLNLYASSSNVYDRPRTKTCLPFAPTAS